MATQGMILYHLSIELLALRGYFSPPWDALTEEDKQYWEDLANKYAEHLNA